MPCYHHYYPQFRYRDNPEPEDNLRTEPVDPKTTGKLLRFAFEVAYVMGEVVPSLA